jgi:hypothetical protein
MSDATPDDDLARAADDLADALRDLRDDVGPRRGPLGLPRPPRPSEVLRLADEAAIPAIIAVLEANIRILEALQRGLRLARKGREVSQRGGDAADRAADARDRASEVSRTTLQRVDSALEDLQTTFDAGDLPEESPAQPVLEDARELRREIDRRLRETTEQEHTLDEYEGDGRENEDAEAVDDGVKVDVDAELDSLRDRYREGGGEDGDGDDSDGDDGGDET